jgi:hypothetical protein
MGYYEPADTIGGTDRNVRATDCVRQPYVSVGSTRVLSSTKAIKLEQVYAAIAALRC